MQEYRAGIPRDELERCVSAALGAPEIDPLGLAAHATRQTVDLKFWRAYALDVGRIAAALARRVPTWIPREIDLGGGFAVPRDPTGRRWREIGALAPTADEYVDVLVRGLTDGLAEGGLHPDGIRFQLEPGRAMYGNAGVHLARVLHIKREQTPRKQTWIETDTSEVFLPDTFIEGNRWTVLVADEPAPERACRGGRDRDLVRVRCTGPTDVAPSRTAG